jgi:hypothetical protein
MENQEFHNLPPSLLDWVGEIGGGKVTHLHRHVARREAWVVDVERADGSIFEGFLRIERHSMDGAPVSLRKEARICDALSRTSVPVPQLHGWNEEHRAALLARDPGRSDIDTLGNESQQRAVMEDFIRVVGRLHKLELDDLGLDDILGRRPQSPEDCALDDLNAQLAQYADFLKGYTDPLLSYGVQWLERFVPEKIDRVSLVQGDTGPVNFMFQDNAVSVVVDWEWGHWGDPMEDLGNICVREFWNPSGGLKGLFELYEQESGIPYQRQSTLYYRVQQNIRGMIPIHAVCANPPPGQSLAWYLCYRYVTDRSTCEGIAEYLGIDLTVPDLPSDIEISEVLPRAALSALRDDVIPRAEDDFLRSRAQDAARLLECIVRKQKFGDWLEQTESEEIAALLGKPATDFQSSNRVLAEAIESRQLEDEPLLQYLARKAYRDEFVYAPVVALYPNRRWSEID